MLPKVVACVEKGYMNIVEPASPYHMQLETAKEELEASMSNLRSQLNVEQQAHTQTQQREADAQKHYQESIVQTQLSKHELEGLKAELQATRSAQHADCLQILKLQQQLTAREEQR